MAASISNTDLEKVRAAGAEKAASFTKTLLPKAEQFRTQTPYTGLSGVSGATGQKLGKYGNLIETVRNVGYRLEAKHDQ